MNNRRQLKPSFEQLWKSLNIPQQFSVSELQRFGYELAFVRTVANGPLAVLTAGEQHASIDSEGQIDLAPHLELRQ